MIADSKTALYSGFWFCCTRFALILMFIRGISQAAVCFDRQNGNRSADVVGHQQVLAIRRQRKINRPRAAGGHLIQLAQLAVIFHPQRLHHALLHFACQIERFAVV